MGKAIREDGIRLVGLPTGEFIAHRTLEHLKTSKAKKEFIFLFLVDAHDHKLTYFAPPRLEEMFLGHPAKETTRKVAWEKDNDYSDEHRRIVRALYDAGIRYSDEALGQLMRRVLGEEPFKNTSFLISPPTTARALARKRGLPARTPLLAGGHPCTACRCRTEVQARRGRPAYAELDVTTTILDLAGADRSGLPGRKAAPSMNATTTSSASTTSLSMPAGHHW